MCPHSRQNDGLKLYTMCALDIFTRSNIPEASKKKVGFVSAVSLVDWKLFQVILDLRIYNSIWIRLSEDWSSWVIDTYQCKPSATKWLWNQVWVRCRSFGMRCQLFFWPTLILLWSDGSKLPDVQSFSVLGCNPSGGPVNRKVWEKLRLKKQQLRLHFYLRRKSTTTESVLVSLFILG